MGISNAFKAIGKASKASGQTTKVVSKTGAVVGGVTAAAVGTGIGATLTAGASNLVDKVEDVAKYIPYIIAGICAVVVLIALLGRKRK